MDKIVKLANLRAKAERAAVHKKALMDEFLSSAHYQSIKNDSDALAAEVDALEKEIKAEYEAAFDGNKKPHPAIQLKEFDITDVKYEARKAHAWCVQNFTPALKLDTAAFVKAAKAGSIPVEIATVIPAKEIRAQIASDLSDYL